jgi:ribosome-binding protein aMBF1 (putative translation factor)
MYYIAHVSREGKRWLAEFPGCPGCQTFATTEAGLRVAAVEALEGWLEAHLIDGRVPPRPRSYRLARNRVSWRIEIDAALSVALQVLWARTERKLTQVQLAKRLGISPAQVARLERPGANPTVDTLRRLARPLGLRLEITLAG